MNKIERRFWEAYRNIHPQTANCFQSQFSIAGYVADFAFPFSKGGGIVIEIDGHDSHKTKSQRSYDARRDRELLRRGWVTIRVTGNEVFYGPEETAEHVHQTGLAWLAYLDSGKAQKSA